MFWGANYIVVRELNFLLKEENVSLTQVLEADDILQECKGDNKALIQFLTKPEVLAELVTLITEEPPKSVELASQYRHANIACEVLTSHLSTLSDRLSLDSAQMNRLCDFINKDPPLNPLLASYFSRTVEMLLERSPKQDWYLYHIVCLRVLDFFKSRRDFLPNLLRHMATSAVADTFKYFIRLDDLFNKIIMEWLEEHQFLESLIQIICGTFQAEPAGDNMHPEGDKRSGDEAGQPAGDVAGAPGEGALEAARSARERSAAVAAANAAALLCDLIVNGCAPEGCSTRARTAWALVARLQAEGGVRALLQAMFTSPPAARRAALVHGCRVLLALLAHDPILAGEASAERSSVELAVAPHLPLLHQALLHPAEGGGVGLARVQAAGLLAHLARSEVLEVPTTLLTLGTPGVLVDLFFQFACNNFLHAQVAALVRHALENRAYRTQYGRHLLVECDLLTRLMDAFEENEEKTSVARAAYMGHVVLMMARVARALEQEQEQLQLPPALAARWAAFRDHKLRPTLLQHDTPLGGYYPSDNTYEEESTDIMLPAGYEFNDMTATATLDDIGEDLNADDIHEIGAGGTMESPDFIADGLGLDDGEKMAAAKNNFLELASQRFDEDMWDDTPEADLQLAPPPHDGLPDVSPWECPSVGGSDEGWAQFGDSFPPPVDPFAPAPGDPAPGDPAPLPTDDFTPLWTYDAAQDTDAAEHMRGLRLGPLGGGSPAGPLGGGPPGPCPSMARAVQLASDLLSAMTARDLASLHDDVHSAPHGPHTPLTDVKDTSRPNTEMSNNNIPRLDSNANTEISPSPDTTEAKDNDEVKVTADDGKSKTHDMNADDKDDVVKNVDVKGVVEVNDTCHVKVTPEIKAVEEEEVQGVKASPDVINLVPEVAGVAEVVSVEVASVEVPSAEVASVEVPSAEVASVEVPSVEVASIEVPSVDVTDTTGSER